MNHARPTIETQHTRSAIDEILEGHETASEKERRWNVLKDQADSAFQSGLLPKHINTVNAARAIAMLGEELGLRPMTAFRVVFYFDGKFALSSELMHALAQRTYPGFKIDYVQSNDNGCWLLASHDGCAPQKFFFTFEMVVAAKLDKKDNWQKYPAAMARARAVAAAVRAIAPRACLGFLAEEEARDGIPFDDVASPEMTAAADAATKKGAAGLAAELKAKANGGTKLADAPPPPPKEPKLADRKEPPPGFDTGKPAGFGDDKKGPPVDAKPANDAPPPEKAPKPPTKKELQEASDAMEAVMLGEIGTLKSLDELGFWMETYAERCDRLNDGAKSRVQAMAEGLRGKLRAAAAAEPGQ